MILAYNKIITVYQTEYFMDGNTFIIDFQADRCQNIYRTFNQDYKRSFLKIVCLWEWVLQLSSSMRNTVKSVDPGKVQYLETL